MLAEISELNQPFLNWDEIDAENPVNFQHPLNRGRITWYMGLPSNAGGGKMVDLISRNHGALVAWPPATSGWRPSTRPGGFSHLQFIVTSYVTATPHPYTLTAGTTGELSFGAWANWTTAVSAFVFTNTSGSLATGIDMLLNSGNLAGHVAFRLNGNTGPDVAGGWNDNKWHRIFGTVSNLTITLYVDGVAVGSGAQSAASASASGQFQIGARANTPSMVGLVDDVTIYRRGLSAREVAMDYQLGKLGYPGVLNRYALPLKKPAAGAAFQAAWAVNSNQAVLGGIARV